MQCWLIFVDKQGKLQFSVVYFMSWRLSCFIVICLQIVFWSQWVIIRTFMYSLCNSCLYLCIFSFRWKEFCFDKRFEFGQEMLKQLQGKGRCKKSSCSAWKLKHQSSEVQTGLRLLSWAEGESVMWSTCAVNELREVYWSWTKWDTSHQVKEPARRQLHRFCISSH